MKDDEAVAVPIERKTNQNKVEMDFVGADRRIRPLIEHSKREMIECLNFSRCKTRKISIKVNLIMKTFGEINFYAYFCN